MSFYFFPNGTDYAYIKEDDNGYDNIYLNIGGSERKLTTYPGDVYDFSFSPSSDYIVFSSERRGETQSWSMRL